MDEEVMMQGNQSLIPETPKIKTFKELWKTFRINCEADNILPYNCDYPKYEFQATQN